MPMRDERSYEEYRQHRLSVLHAYVETARLKAVRSNTFVGIAVDNPHRDYRGASEDLLVLTKDGWTQEELDELERKRQDLNLWRESRVEWSRYRQDEFPQAGHEIPLMQVRRVVEKPPTIGDKQTRKSDKRRKKMQQQSKRLNRAKK